MASSFSSPGVPAESGGAFFLRLNAFRRRLSLDERGGPSSGTTGQLFLLEMNSGWGLAGGSIVVPWDGDSDGLFGNTPWDADGAALSGPHGE